MTKKAHRPPLTKEESEEKRRIHAAYQKAKPRWLENNGEKLTDEKLGELVAKATGRQSPYSQGAVYQFTSAKSTTRTPIEFVQGFALVLGLRLEDLSPRCLPKSPIYPVSPDLLDMQSDPDTKEVVKLIVEAPKEKRDLLKRLALAVLGNQVDQKEP